jgi:dihydrofolate synthase / folylpolyglutamate synthase
MGDDLTAYRQALDALFARTTGVSKFGLERTEAFLAALGRPHLALPVLHVAGTNGKGSTCATMDAVLRAGGLRVGRYTSPHLVDFRERFLIDGRPIDPAWVVAFLDRWAPTVESLGVTFFEATTAMAFQWFADQAVDVAVIETGLGGRLDSTNVVAPMVATVTSIGIDHVEQLGPTRELIAAEKAGIFKAGVPAVVGEPDPRVAGILAAHAHACRASRVLDVWRESPPLRIVTDARGTTFELALPDGNQAVHTPLAGAHQASNCAVALLTVRAAGDRWWPGWRAAREALGHITLPGRFQQVGNWIFDVAHNAGGASVLASTLQMVPGEPVTALLCVLGDKDWRAIMDALAPVVDGFILTNAPTAPTSRAWDLGEAVSHGRAHGWKVEGVPDFDAALRIASARGGRTVVTGSFHTVGDAMDRLQVSPLGN